MTRARINMHDPYILTLDPLLLYSCFRLVFIMRSLYWVMITHKVYGYSSLQSNLPHRYGNSHAIMGSQCYLPPDRGDIPALTPAEAGTRLSDPEGMQGWVDLPCTRRTMLGDRAFPVTAAREALPSSVRSAPSLLQFRRDLTWCTVSVIVLFTIVFGCVTDCNF